MSSSPHQQIPESTQVHVDRLVNSTVGEHQLLARLGEGRWGTLYRAQHRSSGQPATLEVLRSELVGHDEEARAANAIGCRAIVNVFAFGELPDGRRYRLMDPLEGDSLEARVLAKGPFNPQDAARILDQLAVVLEAAHAWAIVHGSLVPSSVFQAGDGVKVIDFGLARQKRTPQDDLSALGKLGFTLLTGDELRDGPLPKPSPRIPEPLDRLLRELVEQRVKNATVFRKQLAGLSWGLEARAPRSRARWVVAALVVLGLVASVPFFVHREPVAPEPVVVTEPEAPEPVEEVAVPAVSTEELVEPTPAVDLPTPHPVTAKGVKGVPSAQALYEQTSRLEAQLRKQARPGDDLEQALFVLNKQRLRLTGSPSLEDRREVARQLAGWKRSYLRK